MKKVCPLSDIEIRESLMAIFHGLIAVIDLVTSPQPLRKLELDDAKDKLYLMWDKIEKEGK